MKCAISLLIAFALAQPLALCAAPPDQAGEVTIRDVVPLDLQQRERLARLIKENPQAKALFEEKSRELHALEGRKPSPLAEIHYEGLLNTDPARISDVEHLRDCDVVAAWFEIWQATADSGCAKVIKEYLSAWVREYRPDGNDVNENKLMPMIVAYESLRPTFSDSERRVVDDWVRGLVIRHLEALRQEQSGGGNRHVKRLQLVAIGAVILGENEWKNEVVRWTKKFIETDLFSDGTTSDLRKRDTLTYHNSTVCSLITLAILMRRDGLDLYHWESPSGSSIKKSVEHVVPYAAGEKVRREWTNSTAGIDHRRAAAGIAKYQPGMKFEPANATEMLSRAELFDPSLLPLVAKLSEKTGSRFPLWRSVINEALRN